MDRGLFLVFNSSQYPSRHGVHKADNKGRKRPKSFFVAGEWRRFASILATNISQRILASSCKCESFWMETVHYVITPLKFVISSVWIIYKNYCKSLPCYFSNRIHINCFYMRLRGLLPFEVRVLPLHGQPNLVAKETVTQSLTYTKSQVTSSGSLSLSEIRHTREMQAESHTFKRLTSIVYVWGFYDPSHVLYKVLNCAKIKFHVWDISILQMVLLFVFEWWRCIINVGRGLLLIQRRAYYFATNYTLPVKQAALSPFGADYNELLLLKVMDSVFVSMNYAE